MTKKKTNKEETCFNELPLLQLGLKDSVYEKRSVNLGFRGKNGDFSTQKVVHSRV